MAAQYSDGPHGACPIVVVVEPERAGEGFDLVTMALRPHEVLRVLRWREAARALDAGAMRPERFREVVGALGPVGSWRHLLLADPTAVHDALAALDEGRGAV